MIRTGRKSDSFKDFLRCAPTCVLVAIVLAALPARAQSANEALERKANELYQQVFSPFCPGRSLNDCPSSKAHDLKLEMRQKLEQGVAPEVILEQVFSQYGDQYRAVPPYEGVGKLVWWAPCIFLLIGAGVALNLARGRRLRVTAVDQRLSSGDKRDGSSVSLKGEPVLSDELRQQIESELARLD